MKKRICALILAVCLSLSTLVMPAAAFEFRSFPDVDQDDWFYECVGWLSALEIINGDTDGNFYPERPIKRSEFIKMISVATELVESATPLRNIHWAEGSWLKAVENGLLEYSQYTKPVEFEGKRVPDVLRSGNHKAIARVRYEDALKKTAMYRPDLLENYKD